MDDRGDQMVVAVLTDLTDRKKTEEILEAERLARSILEQTGEAILVCDRGGVIVRASQAVTVLAGRDPLFRAFDEVLPLRTSQTAAVLAGAALGRQAARGLEVRFERPDGTSFDLILNADPLRGRRPRRHRHDRHPDRRDTPQAGRARPRGAAARRRAGQQGLAAIESLSAAGLQARQSRSARPLDRQPGGDGHGRRPGFAAPRQGPAPRARRHASPRRRRPCVHGATIGEGFAGTVAKLRRSLFVEDAKSSRLVEGTDLKRGFGSLLGAPLLHDDGLLGVITVSWRKRREPDARQQRFLEIIAQRAAAVIAARMLTEELNEQRLTAESAAHENARLFAEQQRIATVLQQHFIHPMPSVRGLDLGVVSHSAYEAELVGGDLSDVFLVDGDHVVVLIGDVAGKGIHAAGLTETVRSTVRALAAVDPAPELVLAKANELLLRFEPDEAHVTAFLAVVDPHTGHVSYASAGHPPPVHLGAFTCRTLDVRFGAPLGSFLRPYRADHTMLTIDDYLVFYTDGVTEARHDGELLGEERLVELVAGLRGRSAQQVAEGVRDAALAFADQLHDDLEVVVLRLA